MVCFFGLRPLQPPNPRSGAAGCLQKIVPEIILTACRPETLKEQIGGGTPLAFADTQLARLYLPTSRTGPLPSPELSHDWELDTHSAPNLATWNVEGLWLAASKAFSVLANLPQESPVFVLGQDTLFWRKAAYLVLEALAGENLIPSIVAPNGNGQKNYLARWLPVLDGPPRRRTPGATGAGHAARLPG